MGQLRNWALCKPSFKPNSINSQKKENLPWEKCRYITGIEKTLSDAAQYFHSKHLKNGPKRFKNYLFQWNGVLGPKDIFQNWLQAAPSCHLNQTYKFIIFNQKGKFFFTNKYFQEVLTRKSFKNRMFKLILQLGFYD